MTVSHPNEAQRYVLLVEDDEACRNSVQVLLEIHGMRVIAVEDGQAAIETLRARQRDVAVVLLDVVLPGLSGHETCQALRDIESELPIVLTSGYDQQQACEEFAAGEFVEFISKAASPEVLPSTLRQYL